MRSIYFDSTERSNARWKALIEGPLAKARRFEIHCWTEETEAIKLALRFGTYQESDWIYGKIISGAVTEEFRAFILEYPKPTDTEIHNKMTPFFNIFLDDDFQSCHWGTEMHFDIKR